MIRLGSIVLSVFLMGCATALPTTVPGTASQSVLKISHVTELNQKREIKRNESVITLVLTPNRVAVVETDFVHPVQAGGFFKLRKADQLFEVKSDEFGVIYCGYKNLFMNKTRTKLSEGCLGDHDNDGAFESFYLRSGNRPDVSVGFVYQDSEIVGVNPEGAPANIPYSVISPDTKHARYISYRFDEIKKKSGQRIAFFEILTKAPSDKKWHLFKTRNPITARFGPEMKIANLTTPAFSIRLSDVTNSKFNAEILSVTEQSGLGFKKTLSDTSDPRYFPAYQTTGF